MSVGSFPRTSRGKLLTGSTVSISFSAVACLWRPNRSRYSASRKKVMKLRRSFLTMIRRDHARLNKVMIGLQDTISFTEMLELEVRDNDSNLVRPERVE